MTAFSWRPILTAVIILLVMTGLTLFIYGFNIDVAVKGSLIGVVIGGGLTFLGQMWSQDVNHAHQIRMVNLDYENRLRMAALDKRLTAHQEAFALWIELRGRANPRTNEDMERLNSLIQRSYMWWNNNCLYLSKVAGEAFSDAVGAAADHHVLRITPEIAQEDIDGLNTLRKANWAKVQIAGTIIASEVGLPGLNIKGKDEKEEKR